MAAGVLEDRYEMHLMRSLQLYTQSVLNSYRGLVAVRQLAHEPDKLSVADYNRVMDGLVTESPGTVFSGPHNHDTATPLPQRCHDVATMLLTPL